MAAEDWNVSYARAIAVYLNGQAIPSKGPRGERVVDDSFFAAFNAFDGELGFRLPEPDYGEGWVVAIDTSVDDPTHAVPHPNGEPTEVLEPGTLVPVPGRSVLVLRQVDGDEPDEPAPDA
jgi:glycogen operon protein